VEAKVTRTRVGVLGAAGNMGRRVVAAVLAAEDLALVAAVSRPGSPAIGQDAGWLAGVGACGVAVEAPGQGCFADADVVIDFSLSAGLAEGLPFVGGSALVSGTTGLGPDLAVALTAQEDRGPVLIAANFSLGVAVLADLVRRAAAALPAADVDIVELHHRRKRDAPSGTALVLAAAAEAGRGRTLTRTHGRQGDVGPRAADALGIHAVRGGDVVGEHTVWLLGDGERIALSHAASSRDTFANGAVAAARWIARRPPGRYYLSEVLGLGPSAP
jgi:4-hydroxy-tetrahydrodipicolinate reductase